MCDCNKTDYSCSGTKVSSDCVIYQGPDSDLLGICYGDPMTFVEKTIIEQIEAILAENQLDLSDVTLENCAIIKNLLGSKDKNLENLLQVLIDYQCTLTTFIKQVDAKIVPPVPYAFNVQCTTPVAASTEGVLQGVINFVCALSAQVAQIIPSVETIVKDTVGNSLSSLITSLNGAGIKKTGSGASTVFQIVALVPPLAGVPYFGPLSNFDGNGKGIAGSAYEGWYLILGPINGTPVDTRGRIPVASVNGVPGGALDAAVNPALAGNSGINYSLGNKFGENFHTLTIAELPAHSHTGNTVSSPLIIPIQKWNTRPQGGGSEVLARIGASTGTDGKQDTSINVTIPSQVIATNTVGGGGAHENRQPSFVMTGWIMRLD